MRKPCPGAIGARRRSGGLRSGAGLLAAALLSAGCGGARPEVRDWNVVVVLLDTLRSDHLSAHGHDRATSPNLDAFAAANVWFTDNRSQASCTWPSVNSLLTSRWPQRFWGRPWGQMGIPEGIPSLAELLTAHGWTSAAVSASPIVRATPSWANDEGGFARGFSLFHEECAPSADAACVNREAAGLIGVLRRPFFLYLHYMDTHGPYHPPPEWPRRFAADYRGTKRWVLEGDVGPVSRMLYHDGPKVEMTAADLEHMIALYDEELAYFDHRFGELLGELRRRGLYDDTLIVFLSDHGESFLEHDHFGHCRSAYDHELRVPLILRVPGVEGPVRVDRPVANLDVAPTLLDYLGIDAAPYGFEGTSLRPLIEGRQTPPRPEVVFGAGGNWRSAADGRFKLIEDLGGGSAALYDLAADPGERRDLALQRRPAVRRLRAVLREWEERMAQASDGPPALEPSAEEERELRALGYL